MRYSGCSGCTNQQIFGTSPSLPADYEASRPMSTRCFETQSSPVCTCSRRSKFLTHFLVVGCLPFAVWSMSYYILSFLIQFRRKLFFFEFCLMYCDL